jgi:hypothetical protein
LASPLKEHEKVSVRRYFTLAGDGVAVEDVVRASPIATL